MLFPPESPQFSNNILTLNCYNVINCPLYQHTSTSGIPQHPVVHTNLPLEESSQTLHLIHQGRSLRPSSLEFFQQIHE